MINSHRGEIAATLDGRTYKLCLTLGALAELESVFGHEDMLALAERFSTGRLAARDIARIIGAGLRAGGNDIGDDTVLAMQAENGVAGGKKKDSPPPFPTFRAPPPIATPQRAGRK